jgi:hypothetical protein
MKSFGFNLPKKKKNKAITKILIFLKKKKKKGNPVNSDNLNQDVISEKNLET